MTTSDSELPDPNVNLFRGVDLEIRRLTSRWDRDATRFEAVCECDDVTCSLSISVDRATFDDLVGRPGRYVVAAAHRQRNGDRTIRRDGETVVVQRTSDPVPL